MKRLFPKKMRMVEKGLVGEVYFGRKTSPQKIVYFYGFVFLTGIIILILGFRLFNLTVVKGSYYLQLSEENRAREITIEATRGTIKDRKGYVLVENKEADIGAVNERINSKRIYHTKEETAHLIGYRQIASGEDLKNDSCITKLKLGDKTGKKGIEALYDCELRGKNGKKLVEVDARGTFLDTLTVVPAQRGKTLTLSLDYLLQKKAYELIKDKKAVVVGAVPDSGELLVYAVSPAFDPQKFEDGQKDVNLYFENKEKPLFNRATEGVYPPGSLFKLFVAAGVLQEQKMNEKEQIEDTGTITAGPLSFGNWYFLQYGKTEGAVDMKKALQRSNDIYFYKAGEKLGPEGIRKWAREFGLGKPTEIGFYEESGLIPSALWKEETLKEKWYLGDTYNMSIGQGYILTTPIQMLYSALPFANGGKHCAPQLLKGGVVSCTNVAANMNTIQIIKDGMKKACEPGGTGWPLFDFKVKNLDLWDKKLRDTPSEKRASVEAQLNRDLTYWNKIETGCKTGTAESHAVSGNPHAWFTVFAPYENPEIMLTILVEEGGQGSDVAAPIARDILRVYFERRE